MNASDRRALRDWPGLLHYPEAWDLVQDLSKDDAHELVRALVVDFDAPLEIDQVVQRLCDAGRVEQAELALIQAQITGLLRDDELDRLSRTIQVAASAPSTAVGPGVIDEGPDVKPPWANVNPLPQRWPSSAILDWLHGAAGGQRGLSAWAPPADDEHARRLVAATRLWRPAAWSVDGVTELVEALAGFLGATWDGDLERHGSDFVCRIAGLHHPASLALSETAFPDGLPLWIPQHIGNVPPALDEPIVVRLHWEDTERVPGVLRCHARTILPLLPDRAWRRERFLARIGRDLPLAMAIPLDAAAPGGRWSRAEAERFAVEALHFVGVEIKRDPLSYLVELIGEQPPVLLHLLRETVAAIDGQGRRSISRRDVSDVWAGARGGAAALMLPELRVEPDLAAMFVAIGLAGGGPAETIAEAFGLVAGRSPAALDRSLAALVELALVQRDGDAFRHAPTGIATALYERLAGEDLVERPPPPVRDSFEKQFHVANARAEVSPRFTQVRLVLEAAAKDVAPELVGQLAREAALRLEREGYVHHALTLVETYPAGSEIVTARLLTRLGDFDKARRLLEGPSAASEPDVEALLVLAEIARGRGDPAGAQVTYEEIGKLGTLAQRLAAIVGAADVRRLDDPEAARQLLEADGQSLLAQIDAPLERAHFFGALADVLADRGVLGDLDTAEALVRDHVLPAAVAAGTVLDQVAAETRMARILRRRARPASDGVDSDHAESCARLKRATALVSAIEDFDKKTLPVHEGIKRARTQPVIETLSIECFKNIEQLDLQFARGSTLPGRWTCIVGLNGAGKTAILQSMVWAVSGAQYSALGDAYLRRARRRVGDQVHDATITLGLAVGSDAAKIKVKVGAAETEIVHTVTSEVDVWAELKRHAFVAYGAGRNLSSARLRPSEGDSDFVRRVRPLIEPFTQLTAAELLLNVDNPAGRTDTEQRAAVLLKRLLPRVFDVDFRIVEVGRAIRFVVDGPAVEALDLAEGYRVAAAWLADLCLAWAETAPDEAASGDPARIRATVLIDEIDVHLHVGLQRVIVSRLRRALPEVQWIVTTHSPYIAASFDRNELVVLDNRSGRVRPLDRQIVSFTVDEVCEWLMGVSPRSGEVEELLRSEQSQHAEVLGQSPEISEEDARRIATWRRRMVREPSA